MEFKINITAIRIYIDNVNNNAERIVLETNLPNAQDYYSDQKTPLILYVDKGKAEEYCKSNFPNVPVRILDI